MRSVLSLIVGVPLMAWFLSQCRKPSGPMGRRVVAAMNLTHSGLTEWGLTHVAVRTTDAILDVGCGGGRTVQKLSALAPSGRVTGIDYSDASVEASKALNAGAIAEGRVTITSGSVAALPFPDGAFDLITAVETHYYWPNLPGSVREVLRVLKPGGTFAIIAETHRAGRLLGAHGVIMKILLRAAVLTRAQHEALLAQAGFTNVAADTKGAWICVTGRRPAA
ncbi:MAG: class I SAM-dependent methyltransferase [Vicinamibacterales bacterium]